MAELPKLKREELERLNARLHKSLNRPPIEEKSGGKPIGEVMLEFAGMKQGLPAGHSAISITNLYVRSRL
jgi:hypothetical protein